MRGFPVWRVLLGVTVLLVGLIIIAVVLVQMNGGLQNLSLFQKTLPPAMPVTLSNFDQAPEGQRVTVEGVLHLPSSTHCDHTCGLWLQDYTDTKIKLSIFIDAPKYSTTPVAPNQMYSLPLLYRQEHFKVMRNDGAIVGEGDPVRLTGTACRTSDEEPCLNQITLIEAGSALPAPSPTPAPTFTPTPAAATFDNACSFAPGTFVTLGGELRLPSALYCAGSCSIYLREPGGDRLLVISIRLGTRANHMERLPNRYQDSDLKIHTQDNHLVSSGDEVIVAGKLDSYEAEAENYLDCMLVVSLLRLP
jgi:hypothetical protein